MQVLAKNHTSLYLRHNGYIAGKSDGIVTVMGKPSARNIYLLDASTMQLLQRNQSLINGHYMFLGLDPDKEYLVMVRDYKKEFEPFAWDFVVPAADLTLNEQNVIEQSWQT